MERSAGKLRVSNCVGSKNSKLKRMPFPLYLVCDSFNFLFSINQINLSFSWLKIENWKFTRICSVNYYIGLRVKWNEISIIQNKIILYIYIRRTFDRSFKNFIFKIQNQRALIFLRRKKSYFFLVQKGKKIILSFFLSLSLSLFRFPRQQRGIERELICSTRLQPRSNGDN